MTFQRFSTERLFVQDWAFDLTESSSRRSLEDALRPILTDKVLEHLPPPLQLSATEGSLSGWIDARSAESDVFVVRQIGDSSVVGLLILANVGATGDMAEVHFGYLFGQNYWGNGFATELIRGFVGEMEAQGPALLIGGIGKTNPASASVLRKVGFNKDLGLSTPDTECFVYSIG